MLTWNSLSRTFSIVAPNGSQRFQRKNVSILFLTLTPSMIWIKIYLGRQLQVISFELQSACCNPVLCGRLVQYIGSSKSISLKSMSSFLSTGGIWKLLESIYCLLFATFKLSAINMICCVFSYFPSACLVSLIVTNFTKSTVNNQQ